MARRSNSNDWEKLFGIICLGAGVTALYYALAGRGKENDAAFIPNRIEDRIDLVVAALNNAFGNDWVNWGLDALQAHLQKVLPAPMVALVRVVYEVERWSKIITMTSDAKQRTAVAWASRGF
jgi:hypothetical protein